MKLDRRSFLGGITASVAMGSPLVRAAGKAEVPLLRLGITSDTHVRFACDMNNPKTQNGFSSYLFEKALMHFRDVGVDAVVHPGDFTEFGLISELQGTAVSWNRVFPNDLGADGQRVEKMFVRGNHDIMSGHPRATEQQALIRDDPAKAWKEVLGIDWYTEKVMLRKVKGFSFILADWGATPADLDKFFEAHGGELPKKAPFFYIQHGPPAGLHDAQDEFGDKCGGDSARCARWLAKYPNAVAFTGHSHYSVTLGDQVNQGEFLSIGCGCLQYMWNRQGRDNSWSLPQGVKGHADRCSSAGHQGLVMRVYRDRLELERWDFANHEKVGLDQVFPLDGSKPYSFDEQRRRARAPQFPSGAALAVSERDHHYRVRGEKWTDERQVVVTVPRAAETATDEGRVYEYECKVFAADSSEPLIVRRVLANGYFLNDARVEKKTIIAFGKDELPADKKLRFEVRAMDCWGNRSKPLSVSR